ncbi:MAG: hypothetical protein ABIT76_13705 [Chthoniobacterales bacterium]
MMLAAPMGTSDLSYKVETLQPYANVLIDYVRKYETVGGQGK